MDFFSASLWLKSIEYIFLGYFALINGTYLFLNVLAFAQVRKRVGSRKVREKTSASQHPHTGMPPISVIMPAYNESKVIVDSVRSLLNLDYPEYEIVVVNDGSRDNSLEVLIEAYDLFVIEAPLTASLKTEHIRNVYESRRFPWLRVVDKENGGKADALNTGLNVSRFELFCCIDADCILENQSLKTLVAPHVEAPGETVASGGTIRIVNGCQIRNGSFKSPGLPSNMFACVQVLEYIRAFLVGRMGWSAINSLMIISGALGLFNRKAVLEAGGYLTGMLGEDMELVVRLHRTMREQKKKYRIVYVPESVCWTEAPESLAQLRKQRIRWQRGMMESLFLNKGLFFSRNGGAVGWFGFLFSFLFEGLGPLLEFAGFCYFIVLGILGVISVQTTMLFLFVSVGMGLLLSVSSLLIEELAFRTYPRSRDFAKLIVASFLENFLFRQLLTYWRLVGVLAWMFSNKKEWGTLNRAGFNPQNFSAPTITTVVSGKSA